MKKGIIIVFILNVSLVQAQFLEFGTGMGLFNYSGDMARGYKFSTIQFGSTFFNRMNFSSHVSLKTALGFGGLRGSDQNPLDPAAAIRLASFNHKIADFSSVFEYDFLNYKKKNSVVRWSPYAYFGLGFLTIFPSSTSAENLSTTQLTIPVGIGFKHLIRRRFMAGFEVGVRGLSFDEIDGISEGDLSQKDFQFGNPNDMDWYSFVGISLSVIIYKVPCPFPYDPNQWRKN